MGQIEIQTAAALSGALLVLVLAAAAMQLKGVEAGYQTRPIFRAFFLLVSLYLLLFTIQLRQGSAALHYVLDVVYVVCHCLLVFGVLRRSGRRIPFWPIVLASVVYWIVEKILPGETALRLALSYSMAMSLLASALLLLRTRGVNFGDIAMAVTAMGWSGLVGMAASGLAGEHFELLNLTLILIFTLPMITALAVFLFLSYTLEDRVELDDMASRDPLTSIYNRRYFSDRAREILSLMQRQKTPVSLIMLDVDNFKQINDRLGHGIGDRALRAIAGSLLKDSRLEDLVARIGGEEFAILLPNTSLEEARAKAERMRNSIASVHLPGIDAGQLTASFGVINGRGEDTLDVDAMLNRADKALYEAKSAGRNTVR